jgi:hypothetical protein
MILNSPKPLYPAPVTCSPRSQFTSTFPFEFG